MAIDRILLVEDWLPLGEGGPRRFGMSPTEYATARLRWIKMNPLQRWWHLRKREWQACEFDLPLEISFGRNDYGFGRRGFTLMVLPKRSLMSLPEDQGRMALCALFVEVRFGHTTKRYRSQNRSWRPSIEVRSDAHEIAARLAAMAY